MSNIENLFKAALDELHMRSEKYTEPQSFQDYLRQNNLKRASTAAYISVDAYEKLNPLLRKNDVMVFRLGSSDTGKGTQFSLVNSEQGLRDYFLFDKELFQAKPQIFYPKVRSRELLSFQILPKLSESSLVNLGLATVLISEALELDTRDPIISPATTKSTFSFDVKLSNSIERVFHHRNGQQITTNFTGAKL